MMKKVLRVFLLIFMVLVMSGCNKEIRSSNAMDVDYKTVSGKEDVIYNVNNSIKKVNGFSFNGIFVIDDKEYVFDGKIVINDTINKSVININYGENSLYIYGEQVYISYYYNNTNVIVKDSLDNFIKEIIASLENRGINCRDELVYDVIRNKTLSDIKWDLLVNYLIYDNGYTFRYDSSELTLNDTYLPNEFIYIKNNIKLNLNFNYEDVLITIPLGYNLLTLDINDIKEILKFDYIGDLIK